MATARDIVKGALRRSNLLGRGESLNAGDAEDALAMLNDMMHSWEGKSLSYAHTTMTLDTTFPLDDPFHMGVKAMLAVRIADEYGGAAVVTSQTVTDAVDGWNMIAGEYWTDTGATVDLTLTRLPSQNLSGYTKVETS